MGRLYMRYRRFGRTGWEVSEVGYGMWGMGGWTGSNDDESRRSLQLAVDLGCNFFDTAPEDELFPLCRDLDVAVIARVPFDEGTLTGTLTKATTWPPDD